MSTGRRMSSELQERVITRLVETGADDKPFALAILAALEGAADLEAYLDDTAKVTIPELPKESAEATSRPEPPGVYVSSITVEAFRGVGDAVTLSLPPGPGLIVVVGRNG